MSLPNWAPAVLLLQLCGTPFCVAAEVSGPEPQAGGQPPGVAASLGGSLQLRSTTDGLEIQLLQDAANGRWDEFTLLEAALIASGVADSVKLQAYRSRFDQLAQQLPQTTRGIPEPAAAILLGLHEHVLTGRYRATCTELDRTLDQGCYNCVTATILYRCLTARAAVPVTIWAEPRHVYCRSASDPPVMIQTTSPHGCGRIAVPAMEDIGESSRTPESSALTTAGDELSVVGGPAGPTYGSRQPVTTGHQQRALTDVQLVAKVYYNRGLAAWEQGRFPAALHLLRISCRLDAGDDIARQNLLGCLNNWALAEADAGQFRLAAAILKHGIRTAPDYRPFLDNQLHVYQRWVRQLCRDGQFAEAMGLLEFGYQQRPEVPLFAEGRAVVCQIWQQALLSAGQPDAAAAVEAVQRTRPRRG